MIFIFVDSEGFFVCPKKKAIEDMIFEGESSFSFPSPSSSFAFLPEGKAVADFLIAIPVLSTFSKSLLTIHNLFRPLGKAVAKLLIAIPVLVNFLQSLFTIRGVLRPSPITFHSNPIHFICFSNPLHLHI